MASRRILADRARRALLIVPLIGVFAAIHVVVPWSGWSLGFGTLLVVFLAAVVGHSHADSPIAAGRIVAIVPAYEEAADSLDLCIRSILAQSGAVVAEVHVVDDGSTRHPVRPWPHPRVIWHRQPNAGKRAAQHHVLSILAERPDTVDFLLTVDSDSVLAADAVAHLLRAFSDPRVTGASGVISVSNADRNLLTRLAELHVSVAVSVSRVAMSLVGTLTTTSGALALYRAAIPIKHRDRYIASGTFGDDRRLTLYAELEGRVVLVPDAVVHSAMPTTVAQTYRQQLRWAKSMWCALGFTLTNMPARHLIFPVATVMRTIINPALLAYLVVVLWSAPASRAGVALGVAGAVWLAWRYALVGLYLLDRRDQPIRRRLLTWLLVTPLEMLYLLLFLLPIQYLALARLRDASWGTRGGTRTAAAEEPEGGQPCSAC